MHQSVLLKSPLKVDGGGGGGTAEPLFYGVNYFYSTKGRGRGIMISIKWSWIVRIMEFSDVRRHPCEERKRDR